MLSHYNVGSNVQQLDQVFGLNQRDRFLGILPFFRSFGFTGTLRLPAMLGVGTVFHPSPLEAKAIGRLVSDYAVTFLLATPTFLQMYVRGCEAEDFGSLRLVMAGAEKLPERVAIAFEEKFGLRPLEGYGCTECSPAVAVNTPDFRAAGFRQVGAKRGKSELEISGRLGNSCLNDQDYGGFGGRTRGFLGRVPPDRTAPAQAQVRGRGETALEPRGRDAAPPQRGGNGAGLRCPGPRVGGARLELVGAG